MLETILTVVHEKMLPKIDRRIPSQFIHHYHWTSSSTHATTNAQKHITTLGWTLLNAEPLMKNL